MGATLQSSLWNEEKRIIISDEAVNDRAGFSHVSGINLLTNHQVNLISAAITAVITGLVANCIF
jgi:uncharacterized membrane protein